MHYLGLRHKHEHEHHPEKLRKTPYVVLLDKVTMVIGIAGPFVVVPQIYSLFSTRSAAGVSLFTWILMVVVNFPWVLYGIAHKEKSILISFVLWEIMNMSVVVGILLYS